MNEKLYKILTGVTLVGGLLLTVVKGKMDDEKLRREVKKEVDSQINTALLAERTETEEA